MAKQTVTAIQSLEDLTSAERDLLDVGRYPRGTQLKVYVVSAGARATRYVAPADDGVRVGSVVEDYGSWLVSVERVNSEGESSEISMAASLNIAPS